MSEIEELIIAATSGELSRPDNDLISKIIDHLKANPADSELASKSIKDRLEDPNVKVQMFALFLIDKSMKKLKDSFISQIGSKQFMNIFVMIATDPETVPQLK